MCGMWCDEKTRDRVPCWFFMCSGTAELINKGGERVTVPCFEVADNEGGEFFTECFCSESTALRYFSPDYDGIEPLLETNASILLNRYNVDVNRMEVPE